MSLIVGVDFDNTIVSYDDVMHKTACEFGYIDQSLEKDKKIIRDTIRLLPDGEQKWQKVQAYVYGKAMDDALLISGVEQFFNYCKANNIGTCIVSHKSEIASADEDNINLRDTAIKWMDQHKFFSDEGLGLSMEQVYFESTRQEKVERIKDIGCTHFIDDLEETFLENKFPKSVEKILFSPRIKETSAKDVKVFSNWGEINEYIFS